MTPTPEDIAYAVSQATGVDLADIRSSTKLGAVTTARRIYASLCVRHTTATFTQIARGIGKGGHSSVVIWLEGHNARIRDDAYVALHDEAHRLLGRPSVVDPASRPAKTIGMCAVCKRPATTRDSEGDRSCVYCKRVEDAHEPEWESYDTTEADAARKWSWRQSVERRKAKFDQQQTEAA